MRDEDSGELEMVTADAKKRALAVLSALGIATETVGD
jgi:hypothetical protein